MTNLLSISCYSKASSLNHTQASSIHKIKIKSLFLSKYTTVETTKDLSIL